MRKKRDRKPEPETLREIHEARAVIKRCLQKGAIFYLDVLTDEVKMLAPQFFPQALLEEMGTHYGRIREELQHAALAWSFEILGTPQFALAGAPCRCCGLPMRIGREQQLSDGGWFLRWYCDDGHHGGAILRQPVIFVSSVSDE